MKRFSVILTEKGVSLHEPAAPLCHPERSGEGSAKAAQSNGSLFVISTEKG